MRFFSLCTAVALLASTTVAHADAPAKPITRDYDIRKLIVHIPDFMDAPVLGVIKLNDTQPATRPAPASPSRDDIVAGIVNSVRGMLPDGPAANVVADKGILHVTAFPDDQARVAAAMTQWLSVQSIEITIQTRLFCLDHKDVAGLDPAVRSLIDAIGPGNMPAMIDDHDARVLLAAAKSGTLMSAPRVTLFQNQRAYVMVATQQAYVSSYVRDPSAQGKSAYKPVISVAEDGFVLDVRASAMVSGNASAISLDCHDQFAKLHAMHDSIWVDPATSEKLPIQVPDISKQTIDHLLTILPGKSALLRCSDPTAFGWINHPAAKLDQDCFVMITASIVTPADQNPHTH
jgi:hypothetical protein